MAEITRAATASLDANSGQVSNYISSLIAGEALDAVSACFIDTDGLVYMGDASEGFAGINPVAVEEGKPVTLFGPGAIFSYSTLMTPGAPLYVSDNTPGALETTAATNLHPVAMAISATDIIVTAYLQGLGASS